MFKTIYYWKTVFHWIVMSPIRRKKKVDIFYTNKTKMQPDPQLLVSVACQD